MYTLPMSWTFRALAVAVILAWGFVPQLACFVPEQMLTQAEQDCCAKMAAECGGTMTMSHACCRAVVRPDAGIVTKATRDVMPRVDVAEIWAEAVPVLLPDVSRDTVRQTDHAPPGALTVSSLVLRI
jgi:hypothetical protein